MALLIRIAFPQFEWQTGLLSGEGKIAEQGKATDSLLLWSALFGNV